MLDTSSHWLQLSLWSVPPLIAVLAVVGAMIRIKNNNHIPGVQAILVLLYAVLWWSISKFVVSIVTSSDLKLLITKIAYAGIVITPVAWFVFAITYTKRQMRLSTGVLLAICIIPVITLALVFTNTWHGLVWLDAHLQTRGSSTGLVTDPGPWLYVHALYSYALMVAATSILAFSISQRRDRLKPTLAVIFAPAIVALTNLFYLSAFNPYPWFDLTTIGFAAGAMILHTGVLRYGLLDSRPVVRERIVHQLTDGIVVLDKSGNIIDINPSAHSILSPSESDLTNTSITNYVQRGSLDKLLSNPTGSDPILLGNRAFDVTSSKLDSTDPDSDIALVFRDVTAWRENEHQLRKMQRKLERYAHIDALTGLNNRRIFMQRLEEEAGRVRRHGSPLSVLLLDLDHFKRVNDTYGHDAGDKVLISVSEVTNNIKRASDVSARLGGEEFALLLPETDQQGAAQLAQRLRKAIEQSSVKLDTGEIVSITTSIGVATISRKPDELENVLKHADNALYRAKDSGRNQVCSSEF